MRENPERIGRLNGKTTYRDFREGFTISTGVKLGPGISDSDIAGALGSIRKRKKNGEVDQNDISALVLQAYYGSSRQFEDEMIDAFLRHIGAAVHDDRVADLRARKDDRIAATRARYLENRGPSAKEWVTPGMPPERAHKLIVQRVAASIAAGRIAGASVYGDAQWAQMAWFCCAPVRMLKDSANQAERFLMDIVQQATPKFIEQIESDEKVA